MSLGTWGALCAPFLCLIFAGCTTLPDNPEIHDATVVMSIAGVGGISRLIVACPVGPPIVTVQKPNRR